MSSLIHTRSGPLENVLHKDTVSTVSDGVESISRESSLSRFFHEPTRTHYGQMSFSRLPDPNTSKHSLDESGITSGTRIISSQPPFAGLLANSDRTQHAKVHTALKFSPYFERPVMS